MPSLFSTIKFRIVLFGLIFPIQSYSQHTSISGRLTDLETGEPLPSATVSAFHKGRLTATVANKDGGFKLQLDAVPDSMKFSMIGYRSKTITGGQGANADSFTITLHRLQVVMEEVVVKPLSAIDIIRQAIIQITRLQPINSFETTGFYREIIRDRDHYFSVSEAIFTTQFDPPKKKYALRLDKGRAKEDVTYTQLFEDYHPGGGPQEAMKHSFLVEIPAFLKVSELEKFEFDLLPRTEYEGRLLYVIAFDQKAGVKQALEKGVIFVDADDFSIVRYEASTSRNGLPYLKGLTGSDKMFAELLGIDFHFKGATRKVNFVRVDNVSLLHHAEIEYLISYKQQRKKLDLDLVLSLELLVSPSLDVIEKKIPKDEAWQRKDLVRNLPTTFDPLYWGMSATISPTQKLSEIVSGIMIANNETTSFAPVNGWNRYNEPLFVSYASADSIIFVPTAISYWEDAKTGPFLYRYLKPDEAIETFVQISKNSNLSMLPDNGFQQAGIMIRDSAATKEHHVAITIGTSGSKKLKLTVSETKNGKRKSDTYHLQEPVAWLKIDRKGNDIILLKKSPGEPLWQMVKTYGGFPGGELQAGFCSSIRFPGDAPKMRPDIRAVYTNTNLGAR